MITLASEYKKLLTHIQDNNQTALVRVPQNEPFIDIDLNSREIVLPREFQDFLSIERDHRAETLYFRVDRFFDDVDLLKMAIIIEYVNPLGEGRIYPVNLVDVVSQTDKIIFGWCIGGEATKAAGNLDFAVRFYSIDQESGNFLYNLNTKSQRGIIYKGIEKINEEESYDYAASTISRIESEITSLRNTKVIWEDID